MWMVKASLWGIVAFSIFFVLYLCSVLTMGNANAFDTTALSGLTIQNLWLWGALLLMVCAGYACVRAFPVMS